MTDGDESGDEPDSEPHDDVHAWPPVRRTQRRGAAAMIAAGMLALDEALGRKPREEAPIVVDANGQPVDIDTDGIEVRVAHRHRGVEPRAVRPVPVIEGRSAVIRVGPEGAAILRAHAPDELLHPELRGGLTLIVPNARTLQGHPPKQIEDILEALAAAGVRPQFVAV